MEAALSTLPRHYGSTWYTFWTSAKVPIVAQLSLSLKIRVPAKAEEEQQTVEEIYNLRRASALLGYGSEKLKNIRVNGEGVGIKPGGHFGKPFILADEIDCLRQPVQQRGT